MIQTSRGARPLGGIEVVEKVAKHVTFERELEEVEAARDQMYAEEFEDWSEPPPPPPAAVRTSRGRGRGGRGRGLIARLVEHRPDDPEDAQARSCLCGSGICQDCVPPQQIFF